MDKVVEAIANYKEVRPPRERKKTWGEREREREREQDGAAIHHTVEGDVLLMAPILAGGPACGGLYDETTCIHVREEIG